MNNYFDICATTPIDNTVLNFITKQTKEIFGNPSSIHGFGQKSKALLERARLKICKSLNCNANEIIFTCGGSISNNIALSGVLKKGDHLITSSYEHPAILKVAESLIKKGVEVSFVKPNQKGIIKVTDIKKLIKQNTRLISIMYVNNEIGTINPIDKISILAKEHNILTHTDAVQAMGKIKVDIKNLNVDFISLSGHKFYAPKGVGLLYVKEETPINPILFGGGQEFELFPGTENIVNIAAMAEALELCCNNLDTHYNNMKNLDNYFISLLEENNVNYRINGENRVPGILNITLPDTHSPSFIVNLDRDGYAIASGSACASGSLKNSHTLKELGFNDDDIKKSYRISFGKSHNKDDVKNLFKTMIKNIHNKVTVNK